MNEQLIANWNAKVQPYDTIYHLGDFTLSRCKNPEVVFSQLNGRKHLIVGNHDHHETQQLAWESTHDLLLLDVDNVVIMLSHYPLESWPFSHYGSFHFHGHTHGKLSQRNLNRLDVGVDSWDYSPVSLNQLCEVLTEKRSIPCI